MAQIKYLDSRRIMGESDGTDIAPTFEDKFSSDNWTDSDSAKMGVQSGYLYAYGQRDGTNDSSSRSLGTTLNGDFVFRTKVDITSWSAGSVGYGKGVIIGLSDQDNTANDATSQDSISISISARQTNGDGFYAYWSNNQNMSAGGSTRIGSLAISTGILYFEIIKNGTTVTYNIYSDNLYSTLVATATHTSVTATGFTYAVVRNENGTASSQSGYVEADIDDWEVFAGVTSVTTGKPKQPLSLSGCKAYYNFEQTSGSLTNIATTANGFSDGLGSSADGTVQNITRNATGKLGSYAYTFNGTTSSSKVTLGSSYSQFVFLRSADSTVSVWLKKAETSTTSFRTIIAEHYGGGGQSGIRIAVLNNKFNIVVYNSGSSVVVSTTDFDYPQNTDWHHVVIKFDYTNSLMTVYVDGSSLGTKALGSTSSGNSSLYASLGDDQGGDGNWYGDMDDLALFSRALTSSEISALYNSGTGVAVNDSSLQAKPETNSIFVETDTAYRYWFNGTNWINPLSIARGVFGGGSSDTNVIEYIEINTLGNSTDFGDLTSGRGNLGAVHSDTRAVFGGGETTGSEQNIMDYITIATTGNALDFGDLTVSSRGVRGFNSDTRGVFMGGYLSGYRNELNYITIATTGNATDFGDMTVNRTNTGTVNSDTRGCTGGGDVGGKTNVIDYVTIATTGNATDFGDLTVARDDCAGVNSTTRGVIGGGDSGSPSNVMDYITIATTGNATDFGDLTASKDVDAGANSVTRGVFAGGIDGTNSNVIEYITINTTGNALDFGDLLSAKTRNAGANAGL
jgi:hypothetical protein